MKIAGIALIIMLAPMMALAHGGGLSFTATSSEYTIDIGYDPEELETGVATVFDFLLWRSAADPELAVGYDHVWVRIIRDRETVFASGVAHQQLGPTTLMYMFEEPGTYVLATSFRDADGNTIAEAEIPFQVVVQAKDLANLTVFVLPVVTLLLLSFGFVVGRRYAHIRR